MKARRKWIIFGALIAAIALAFTFALNRKSQTEHVTAKVERGDIDDVVEATGVINPIVTVLVGSQVSGSIAKLNADFNSVVHKGDVVALIDPALFEAALLGAKSDLEDAKANLMAARANQAKLKAALVQTKADYERAEGLVKGGVQSQQQLDLAKANYDSSKAAVDAAAANVAQAEAQVSQKEAAVKTAQTNLDYTVIRSPIDGTVVARNVDLGQTVAASFSAPTIFTIAKDLKIMWVYTKTDESDVGNIKVGKPVTFKVDAFPKETFNGVVKQIRMNPTTVQSVVTYDTIIEFANPNLKLFPGMTAYVTIPVATVQNALKLPNTALRYKPPMSPEEILAVYRQYGIEDSGRQSAGSGSGIVQASEAAKPDGPAPARGPKSETAVVWKLGPNNTLVPVEVSLGITDHAFTEILKVLKGDLKQNDALVIRSIVPPGQGIGALHH
jgi:HlyD family secretion protein